MARPLRRRQYIGKKLEYIRKDAIANIIAKMVRWNIRLEDIEQALDRMKGIDRDR